MRLNPWKCPECGEAARGTVEVIRGLALLVFDEQSNAEYEGETKIDWDSQVSLADTGGRVTLECPQGHQWRATAENVPDWKTTGG